MAGGGSMGGTGRGGAPLLEQQDLFSPATRAGWECFYRIPKLVVSAKGTVLAIPEERIGNVGDGSKQSVVVRRSFDNGRTWLPLEPLVEHRSDRVGCNVLSAVADLESGRIFLFYGVRAVFPEEKGEIWQQEHPGEAEELERRIGGEENVSIGHFIIHTDDEGVSWSDPSPCAIDIRNPVTLEPRRFWPGPGTGIQLRAGPHAGRLVVPGRGWAKGGAFDLFAYSHNFVALSDNHGASWRAGGLSQTGMGEACVAELEDGTVYLNSRNESLRFRGLRAWDRSDDGGESFIESGYDRTLVEPHCHASMARHSAGKGVVLFCNPAVKSDTSRWFDGPARRLLTVRLSSDGCRSWPVSRVLHEGGSGYSDLDVAGDGTVLCLYEASQPGASHSRGLLRLARFDLAWVRGGT